MNNPPGNLRIVGLGCSAVAFLGLWIVSFAPYLPRSVYIDVAGKCMALLSIPGLLLSLVATWRQGRDRWSTIGIILGLVTLLYVPTMWVGIFPGMRK
jgi:hypothetical protein